MLHTGQHYWLRIIQKSAKTLGIFGIKHFTQAVLNIEICMGYTKIYRRLTIDLRIAAEL